MHPVGDVVHRVFFGIDLRPQLAANLRGHVAVDARDAVLMARAAHRQRGHVEFVLVVGVATEIEKALRIHAELRPEVAEVFHDHVGGEMVVTSRHRRMGGEYGIDGDRFQRAGEIQSLGNQFADTLEDEESRMPFVDVPDRGLEADGRQRACAADPEHDLLLDAHVAVAAVELVGNVAVGFGVVFEVGIEQVERDMPHARLPHLDLDRPPRHLDTDGQRLVVAQDGRDWQIVEIDRVVVDELVAVRVDALGEIPLAVEETDRHERQVEVAGGLAMVAGKDAEPAGIDRKAFVQAEFGAEIGDQVVLVELLALLGLGRIVLIAVVGSQHPVVIGQERLVLCSFQQAIFVDATQENLGVVAGGVPQAGVELGEQAARGAVPAIPQVFRELLQTHELARELGHDIDAVDFSVIHFDSQSLHVE